MVARSPLLPAGSFGGVPGGADAITLGTHSLAGVLGKADRQLVNLLRKGQLFTVPLLVITGEGRAFPQWPALGEDLHIEVSSAPRDWYL